MKVKVALAYCSLDPHLGGSTILERYNYILFFVSVAGVKQIVAGFADSNAQ